MRLIKTVADHEAALEELEALMIANPSAGDKESDQIELLGFLIEVYEKEHYSIAPPHPVEAIRFTMEQQDLKQTDLVPFIGSKSRVSEILSGKRGLTLDMVRKLHKGLEIPLKSLVNDPDFELLERIETDDYPVKQMFDKGYFIDVDVGGKNWLEFRAYCEEALQKFFDGRQNATIGALNRQTTRAKSKIDVQALHAWRCRVLDRAQEGSPEKFARENLTQALIDQLIALSNLPEAPLLVQKRLREAGIILVIEPHLQKTHLDGAAMWHSDGFPVIGLTIRHDREDNFWFTLFHELGHLWHHFDQLETGFLDADIDSSSSKRIEQEADQFALDVFIPANEWPALSHLRYAKDIRDEANRRGIPKAVIAGRLRREAADYRKHRTLIGQGEIGKHFFS